MALARQSACRSQVAQVVHHDERPDPLLAHRVSFREPDLASAEAHIVRHGHHLEPDGSVPFGGPPTEAGTPEAAQRLSGPAPLHLTANRITLGAERIMPGGDVADGAYP